MVMILRNDYFLSKFINLIQASFTDYWEVVKRVFDFSENKQTPLLGRRFSKF